MISMSSLSTSSLSCSVSCVFKLSISSFHVLQQVYYDRSVKLVVLYIKFVILYVTFVMLCVTCVMLYGILTSRGYQTTGGCSVQSSMTKVLESVYEKAKLCNINVLLFSPLQQSSVTPLKQYFEISYQNTFHNSNFNEKLQ